MYIWALHTCAPLLPSYTVRVMSFKAYQWKLFGLKRFVLQVVQPDDTHFNSVFLETTSWKPVVTTTQIVMDRFTYSVSLKLLLELRIWKNILKMPVTRRVKGCTRLVGKYVTGRRKLFRPHKVYIVLIRITRRVDLAMSVCLLHRVANYWLKSLYPLQGYKIAVNSIFLYNIFCNVVITISIHNTCFTQFFLFQMHRPGDFLCQ